MTAAPKQFMDCIRPMPVVEGLSTNCWGAAAVGARDQGNGLEDRTMSAYSYWDGAVFKSEENGRYYLFASRWEQAEGHWGWLGSRAVVSVSDSLWGPYEERGQLWPDWCEGAGHNVFPFRVSETDPLYGEGYRYAICVSDTRRCGEIANGTLHIARSLDGPWELLDNGNGGLIRSTEDFWYSNVSIAVRPEGGYVAVNRWGFIVTADSLGGFWEVKIKNLWSQFDVMKDRLDFMEDGVIWQSSGLYHIVVNDWSARRAYYLTSADCVSWTIREGLAYTPEADFLRYEDGTVNRWTKLERPNVYLEDGVVKAMTFAVIDVHKEEDLGNDDHGSKVIVVPFDGEALAAFDRAD